LVGDNRNYKLTHVAPYRVFRRHRYPVHSNARMPRIEL
jgi:hypothetical protein